jgi:hypothetical protein
MNENAEEAWTVTVPAAMEPGDTAAVSATGTFDSTRKLVVDAADTVTLLNSITGADAKVLAVTFAGIELAGSNTEAVDATADISVADIEDALFGTWYGTLTYTAELVNA